MPAGPPLACGRPLGYVNEPFGCKLFTLAVACPHPVLERQRSRAYVRGRPGWAVSVPGAAWW